MTAKTELPALKRRTRAEVHQLVAEFVNSGKRRSEFCQQFSLAGRLVSVELAARKSPKQNEPSCGLAAVPPGGRDIEVHPDFDTSTFERLVGILERA
ncbi:MAG: hypothetical protein WA653_05975 [Candidatus Sulfotelmatobacter sp.]